MQKPSEKNIGDDLKDGKATMPLLYALQQGTPAQQEKIRRGLTEGSLEPLPDILQALEETKAIEYTKSLAQKEVELAKKSLTILPNSTYKEGLVDLAEYTISRNH